MGAEPGQTLLQFVGPDSVGPAARHQQQMLDAIASDQMFGEERAQHPRTAGDQHRAFGIQHRRGNQDDLSGVPGLAHVAEGRGGVQQAVAGGGQRIDETGGEELR